MEMLCQQFFKQKLASQSDLGIVQPQLAFSSPRIIWSQKKDFWLKNNFGIKNFCSKENVLSKKVWVQKKFQIQKDIWAMCPKKIRQKNCLKVFFGFKRNFVFTIS